MPKASALRFHQSNGSRPNGAPLALRKHSRVLRHRRAPADCFGANPVASALGNPTRRDPGGVMRTYHEGRPAALNTGTFYFGGNRNFLLWSDTAGKLPVNNYVFNQPQVDNLNLGTLRLDHVFSAKDTLSGYYNDFEDSQLTQNKTVFRSRGVLR